MNEVLKVLKPMFESGMVQSKMASELNRQGFKTPHGANWEAITVSKFLTSHGYRRNKKVRRGVVVAPKSMFKPKAQTAGLHNNILDIMTSNMSDELKVKVLKAIL